jgi:hypothetical protein
VDSLTLISLRRDDTPCRLLSGSQNVPQIVRDDYPFGSYYFDCCPRRLSNMLGYRCVVFQPRNLPLRATQLREFSRLTRAPEQVQRALTFDQPEIAAALASSAVLLEARLRPCLTLSFLRSNLQLADASVSSPEAAEGLPSVERSLVSLGPINVRSAHASDNARDTHKETTSVSRSVQTQKALTNAQFARANKPVNLTRDKREWSSSYRRRVLLF